MTANKNPTAPPRHAQPAPILPDLLRPGLKLVFCGTAPSRASAAAGAYYAHPGNAFWRALADTGLTPRRLAPIEFRMLDNYGIGLTDLGKHCSGTDAQLPPDAFDTDSLRRRILACAPRWLAFTSKNGARAYYGRKLEFGAQPWQIGPTQVFVLPSPSGQARRSWDLAQWQELARRVAAGDATDPGFEA